MSPVVKQQLYPEQEDWAQSTRVGAAEISAWAEVFFLRMKKYIALTLAIIVLGGGSYLTQRWFFESSPSAAETPRTQETSEEPSVPIAQENPTAEILTETEVRTTASSQASTYAIPILSEGSVLDAMHAYAEISDFSFSGRNFSGLGLFVEEINGLKNGNGFYWTLFINNTLSEKGASFAGVIPGDFVEWRYQKGI